MAGMGFASTASASLETRPGGMVYDTDLNITWVADANLFKTQSDANPNLVNEIIAAVPVVYHTINGSIAQHNVGPGDFALDFQSAGDVRMNWYGATAWAQNLVYGGYSDWRLPTAAICGDFSCASAEGELGHLFYQELGGTTGSSILTGNPIELAKFSNIPSAYPDVYWETEFPPAAFDFAWSFNFRGYTNADGKQIGYNKAWAVRTGDVAAVPLPAAVWLFGSALTGLTLLGARRRRG